MTDLFEEFVNRVDAILAKYGRGPLKGMPNHVAIAELADILGKLHAVAEAAKAHKRTFTKETAAELEQALKELEAP